VKVGRRTQKKQQVFDSSLGSRWPPVPEEEEDVIKWL